MEPTQIDISADAHRRSGWILLWLISALPWALAIALLATNPVYIEAGGWARYSERQVWLAVLALILWLAHLVLAGIAYRNNGIFEQAFRSILTLRKVQRSWTTTILVANGMILFLFLAQSIDETLEPLRALLSIYIRLQPIAWALLLESLILIGALQLRTQESPARLDWTKLPGWKLAGGVLAGLLSLWGFMSVTGAGLTPDLIGWGETGVPLLFYQALLSALGVLALRALRARLPNRLPKGLRLDLILCCALWTLAAGVWNAQPFQRSFFTIDPTPPNFEIYPYSDAGFYDSIAQNLLIGHGFMGGRVVPRPLYILLLAGLHAIAGQSYPKVIFLQTLILAAFPVFLYLLGRELHSRSLGLFVAGLAIFREVNAILSTPFADVSTSKQLLADLPAALVLVVAGWLFARWLKDPLHRPQTALLAGGVLGITALVRAQVLLLIPFLLAPLSTCYGKEIGRAVRVVLIFCLGFGLVFAPWIGRNWIKNGKPVLDDPNTQTRMIAGRYSSDLTPEPRLTSESDSAYAQRLSASIRRYVWEHPLEVAGFISHHFLHNLASTVLALPLQLSLTEVCNSWVVCEPFWLSFTKRLSLIQAIGLTVQLTLLAIGIAASWQRWGWPGLIPLLIFLGYNLSNAIARNSARRYILPVDWVGYFYAAIGLIEIAMLLAPLFGANPRPLSRLPQAGQTVNAASQPAVERMVLTGGLLFLVGISLPLAELVVPPRYQMENRNELANRLADHPGVRKLELIWPVDWQDEGMELLPGKALYPSFFKPLKGRPDRDNPHYTPYPDGLTGKLGFVLLTPASKRMACLALHRAPSYFPNAVDVLVMGRMQDTCLEVLVVAFTDGSDQAILSDRASEFAKQEAP